MFPATITPYTITIAPLPHIHTRTTYHSTSLVTRATHKMWACMVTLGYISVCAESAVNILGR